MFLTCLHSQDPLNTSETVIIVRSVVPGGIAQLDGRLLPGDRIMYVNDASLDTHTSLDCAVQALKGAPFGPVRIGIARPINTEQDSNPSRDNTKDEDIIGSEKVKKEHSKYMNDDENELLESGKRQIIGVSISHNVLSTKSTATTVSTSYSTTTTAERSPRESASDTFAEGSNLSDWKTDYGVCCALLLYTFRLYTLKQLKILRFYTH